MKLTSACVYECMRACGMLIVTLLHPTLALTGAAGRVRWSALLDAFIKIVGIDLFHWIQRYRRYPNIILDHQICELFPINQHNFASNLRNITSSILGKSGSRNEYALVCFLSL